MAFDVEKMTEFAQHAIADFAAAHPDETFYAFAIDAGLLCLNSVENLEKRFASLTYQPSEERVESMKYGTGDWQYQGFAQFNDDEQGFDSAAYAHHYEIGFHDPHDHRLDTSDYAVAMLAVIDRLVARNAFACLNTTPDFKAITVEHTY